MRVVRLLQMSSVLSTIVGSSLIAVLGMGTVPTPDITPTAAPGPKEVTATVVPDPQKTSVSPDDVVLEVAATATSSTGAVLHLSMVVHRPYGWEDSDIEPALSLLRVTRSSSVVADPYWLSDHQGRLMDIELTATPVGESVWPTTEPILVATGPVRPTGYEGIVRVPITVDDSVGELSGAGSGHVVVAYASDALKYQEWFTFQQYFGFPSPKAPYSISSCNIVVTALGESSGLGGWAQDPCRIGQRGD